MAEAKQATGTEGPTTRTFEAEVSRLLHLMVHSVYSNRDVFLRELISNAADACERLRTLSLSEPELAPGDTPFHIVLSANKTAGTLTIEDNGIGMSREELIDNLGTIARSGTRAFLDSLPEDTDKSGLIGQFGIGFYSAFMVASEVEVVSRRAGADTAWRWRSDGKGTYEVEAVALDTAPARGTRVLLKLTEDAKDYAEQATIERVVAAYSAHVPVPIVLQVGDGQAEKTLADGSAVWRKPKAQVSKEEYAEFYGHVSGQFDEPALTVHYRAEGRNEYSVLLFVPSMKPFDLFNPDRKGRIKLYVRRVFITDDAPILPAWLRFVRGVIDSEDLPLNLSREMLQSNPVLAAIGKAVTSRVLTELDKLAADDKETFEKVWAAFGAVLKEGLYEDAERRDALYKIARFKTSTGWRDVAEPRRLCRRPEAEPDRDLLCARRERGGDPRQPATGRLHQARHRGAGALRPGRRVLGAHGAGLRGQAVPVSDARRGRARHDPDAGRHGGRGRGCRVGKRGGDACRALQADARRQGQRRARVEAAGDQRGLPGGA